MHFNKELLLGLFGFGLAFYMNAYKLALFNSLQQGEQYKIFPWQTTGAQLSKSVPGWLSAHLVISLIHVFISSLWLVIDYHNFRRFHVFSHGIFCGVILRNLTNFGEFSQTMAFLMNTTPLLVMSFLLGYNQRLAYYLVLLSPVMLEVGMFALNWLK